MHHPTSDHWADSPPAQQYQHCAWLKRKKHVITHRFKAFSSWLNTDAFSLKITKFTIQEKGSKLIVFSCPPMPKICSLSTSMFKHIMFFKAMGNSLLTEPPCTNPYWNLHVPFFLFIFIVYMAVKWVLSPGVSAGCCVHSQKYRTEAQTRVNEFPEVACDACNRNRSCSDLPWYIIKCKTILPMSLPQQPSKQPGMFVA